MAPRLGPFYQYDRPHLHLSLRVGFAIRDINLRASRAFCEFFVTLACWPYVTCRRCRACDQRVACSVPGFSAMKQGTRRYEEARKRQERSPCAPGWLACAVTNDAEILPSQNDAEDRHREYQINANARLRRNGTFDHDSRTAQQIGRECCIPVLLKTYGSDVAYATDEDGKAPRRTSFRTDKVFRRPGSHGRTSLFPRP